MEAKRIFIFVSLSINLLFIIHNSTAQQDTFQNKPNVKVNVHIQRDANGNIIRYDSSYVETWSSEGQDFKSSSHFKTYCDTRSNKNMFFNFPFFDSPYDSIFDNPFSFPDFDNPFSFPDFDKLNKEILNEIKLFYNHFNLQLEEPKGKQPVKKEKISFKATNI